MLFRKPSDLQASPYVRFSSSLFSHAPLLICVFALLPVSSPSLFPHCFPIFFNQPLLTDMPSYSLYCLSLMGTNHYSLTNSHAFPLSLKSQGIIILFVDSLETYSRRQIAFGIESPKGTITSRLPTSSYSILIQFPFITNWCLNRSLKDYP